MVRGSLRPLHVLLAALVTVGAVRFVYGIVASPTTLTSETHMNLAYGAQEGAFSSGRPPSAARWWGPLFPLTLYMLGALEPPRWLFNLLQRLFLAVLYLTSLLLLTRAVGPPAWFAVPDRLLVCRALLVFLGLQWTAAIYAISGGMGEPVAAFCVVAHHWFFARKRYLPAAVLISVGVYFKLWPLVFLGPYVLFALQSRPHRPYIAALTVSVLAIGAVSVPVMGWWYGALYPVAMITNILTIGSQVPTGSAEVIGLVFLAVRVATEFSYAAAEHQDLALVQVLSRSATLLLVAVTACAAVVLARAERRWTSDTDRRTALLLFDATIGFCAVLFSLDLSLAHLLYVTTSFYGLLLLWSVPPGAGGRWRFPARPLAIGLFAAGLVLVGGLAPLSLVFRVVPLDWFDALAGNDMLLPLEKYVWYRIPLAKYMWYQVPLVGVFLIAASWAVTWLARSARRAGGDFLDKQGAAVQYFRTFSF